MVGHFPIGADRRTVNHRVTLADIQIRDPFVLPVKDKQTYFLYGSTDENIWSGPGTGFNCYRSVDLEFWEGPFPAFRPPEGFWGTTQFWAPEVHEYRGEFYLFATFKAEERFRGTQILKAERPEGPYLPWSDGPVTPKNWECLDGTLHIDDDGAPWMIFCHEWKQIHDGAIYARRLSPDLRAAEGPPVFLFNASEAPWAVPLQREEPREFPIYVTDGPFIHRTSDGSLLMLWSSMGRSGYAMGVARSTTGTVPGPWQQADEPIWYEDGGHGMIFRDFDDRLYLALHQPNDTPHERTVLQPIEEHGPSIRLEAPQ